MTPLLHAHHRPVSRSIQTNWLARRRELEYRLLHYPDADWAWLWKMRLRVFNYLISRYGADEATTRDDAAPVRLPATDPPPREPAPVAPAPKHTLDEAPADQLETRNRARERFARVLANHCLIGEQVRARAQRAQDRARTVALRERLLARIAGYVVIGLACLSVLPGILAVAGLGIAAIPEGFLLIDPTLSIALLIFGGTCLVAAGVLASRRAIQVWRSHRFRD